MALPSYVTKRDVKGDFQLENVVILSSGALPDLLVSGDAEFELVLLWDDLDGDAQEFFDTEIAGSQDLVDAMKSIMYKNQVFFNFCQYAIEKIVFEVGRNILKRKSLPEIFNRTFDTNFDNIRVGRYSINSALSTFRTFNVFSYTSAYGLSRLRDDVILEGTGGTENILGKIRLSTGTTAGSSCTVRTVKRGRYITGKASEATVGVKKLTQPTGDAKIEVGLQDQSGEGCFFRFEESGASVVVVRDGIEISSTPQSEWNINRGDGLSTDEGERTFNFRPYERAYVYNIRYSWCGIGKIIFEILEPINGEPETLTTIPLHEFNPFDFNDETMIDPNLPISVSVENGTTTDDIQVDLSGRRFDILGAYEPEIRFTPVDVSGSVGGGQKGTVFAIRVKEDFPNAGRAPSISAFLRTVDVYLTTNNNAKIRAYSAPRGTIAGATWLKPPDIENESETGLEYTLDTVDLSSVSNKDLVYGPKLVISRRVQTLTNDPQLRVELTAGEEFIVEIESLTSSINYETIFQFGEEW